jgi:hypothetical protein
MAACLPLAEGIVAALYTEIGALNFRIATVRRPNDPGHIVR